MNLCDWSSDVCSSDLLSSWRRAFRRLAFQPRGVCADTGVYSVFKEQRRERIISLSYTSRKIGLFITPSVEIFQNSLQMGKPFANGMMHGRLSGVFSCSDLQLRQSANYVRNDTPPLRGRELRQSLFQQPLQLHALQRLVRLLRQIQRIDRKSTRLNSSHTDSSRMPSSA